MPYLAAMGVGGLLVGIGIGAGILLSRGDGKDHATQEDIQKALNTPPPAATYELQATPTYPAIAAPTSSSSSQSLPPATSTSKPVDYSMLTRDEIVAALSRSTLKTRWAREAVELLGNPHVDFYGLKGNFSSDSNEDIVLITYIPSSNVVAQAIFLKGNSFQGFEETYGENMGLLKLGDVFAHNFTGASPYIVIVHPGEERTLVQAYNFEGNRMNSLEVPQGSRVAIKNLDGGADELMLIEPSGRPHVYKFSGNELYRSSSSEVQLESATQSMVDVIRTSKTPSEAFVRLTDLWDKNPEQTFVASTLIGGKGLEVYLDDKLRELGLSITFQSSAQLRDLFFNQLITDVARRDVISILRDFIFAYVTANATANTINALPGFYTTSAPRDVPLNPFLTFDGQTYGPFSTPEDKEKRRRELEQQKSNWYAYRTVESVTDPNTGTTRTVGIYATEEQARDERLRRERQRTWEEGVRKEKEAFGFSPAEMLENILKSLLGQK